MNKTIEWVRGHSSNLLYGALSVVGLLLLANHFLGKKDLLSQKNDALFIQQLIEGRTSGDLDPYISRVFKRVGGLTGVYEDFAKTSILIKNRDFKTAFEQAKKLKQTAGLDRGSFLYAYNLLRIVSLAKEVGLPQEELEAIEALQNNPQSYSFLEKSFKNQQLSLAEYLEARKQLLTQQEN